MTDLNKCIEGSHQNRLIQHHAFVIVRIAQTLRDVRWEEAW